MSRKSRGKLKIEHDISIRDNYTYLQEELEPVSVAEYLYEKGIFNKDDLEEIRSGKTRKQKATELIDKIQHAGPHDAFEIFLQSLEKEQKHITYRLIKSTHEWLENGRCPSPQSIQRDTTEKICDPLLLELDRLNEAIVILKKENEQLREENKTLAQKLAAEIKEKVHLTENRIYSDWHLSKRFKTVPNVVSKSTRNDSPSFESEKKKEILPPNSFQDDHQCCEIDQGACRKRFCQICDNGVRQSNMLQFELEMDAVLEQILLCATIKPLSSTWQEIFVFVADANLEKSLKVLLDKEMGVNVFAALTRKIYFFPYYQPIQLETIGHVSPLMAAASNRSYKTLKLLLEAGADVNATDILGDTPLIYLCRYFSYGHPLYFVSEKWENSAIDCLNALISLGANVDAKGKDGMTALMHCAKNGNTEFSNILFQKVPNMNIVCDEGKTVLMHACYCHRVPDTPSPINIFFDKCDINAKDKNGNAAVLHCLLVKNDISFFELLNQNVDLDIQNNEGNNVLLLAIKLNLYNVFSGIKEYHSTIRQLNLNLKDNDGNTALINAVKLTQFHTPNVLFIKEMDVNVQNNEGETALMIAAVHFKLDFVKILIDAGANVNIRDNKGKTILKRIRDIQTIPVQSWNHNWQPDKQRLATEKETITYMLNAGAIE